MCSLFRVKFIESLSSKSSGRLIPILKDQYNQFPTNSFVLLLIFALSSLLDLSYNLELLSKFIILMTIYVTRLCLLKFDFMISV